MTFDAFPLHERLHRAVESAGFETPTPIQQAALPIALAGHDLIGTAQTGTGKTAAFVLPILQQLLSSPRGHGSRALILAPTRELAEQIHTTIEQLGQHTNIRSFTVYGGVGMMLQERSLRKGVDIIVACPGRLLDHIARGYVDFRFIQCLVLDEADRMLDMGFLPSITRIVESLPRDRQTMLFSATFAPEVQQFADRILRNPQRVGIALAAPAETIEHALYPVPQHLKTALLTEVLRRTATDSVLVFTRTKHRANRVAEQLTRAGYPAGVLHANKSQNHRQAIMDAFRAGTVRLLVATDIAARGIDVSSISHVINYDVPDCPDAYIHRIGRTGRMERTGEALTFVTLQDTGAVRDIERALGARIDTRMVASFDYGKPAPKVDEFQRPPRNASRAAAPSHPSTAAPRADHRPKTTTPRADHRPKGSVTASRADHRPPGTAPAPTARPRQRQADPPPPARGRRKTW